MLDLETQEKLEALTEELLDTCMEAAALCEKHNELERALGFYERVYELQSDADGALRAAARVYLRLAAAARREGDSDLERRRANAAAKLLRRIEALPLDGPGDRLLAAEAAWRAGIYAGAATQAREALKRSEGEAALEIAALVKAIEATRRRWLEEWRAFGWEEIVAPLRLDAVRQLLED